MLPNDMWREILSFLKPSLVISHFSVLSREWQHFVQGIDFKLQFISSPMREEINGMEVCLFRADDHNDDENLKQKIEDLCLCSALKGVKYLDFEKIPLNDELVCRIARCEHFSNLKHLNIYNSEITIESCKEISKGTFANSLEMLDLEGQYIERSHIEEFLDSLEKGGCEKNQLRLWYFVMGSLMREKKDKTKDYVLELFNKAADIGHGKAFFLIGVMNDFGEGIPVNGKQAMESYLKALELGVSEAALNLGVMYRDGLFVEKNIVKTIEYYSMAERMGDAKAMFYLSILYMDGEGFEQDLKKGYELAMKSSRRGDSSATCRIGQMYLRGEGVEVDEQKAFHYFDKAARMGNAQAQHHLGVMYRNGEFVGEDIDKSFEYYLLAAKKGHSSAQLCVADCYERNKNDMDEAMKWYMIAAMNDNEKAALYAGSLLANGKKVAKNMELALTLFEKAAEKGNLDAQFNVGLVYESGCEEIPRDIPKSIQWYQKAAYGGHDGAQHNLALLYLDNFNDLAKAKEYLVMASELGNPYAMLDLAEVCSRLKEDELALNWIHSAINLENYDAMLVLGRWYKEGEVVELDNVKAVEWFEKSATGCYLAIPELAYMYRNGLGCEKDEEKANTLMQSIANDNEE